MKVEEMDEIKGTEIYEILKKLFCTVSNSNLSSVEKSMIFQSIGELQREITWISKFYPLHSNFT